jgi:hypothetical protein
VLGDGQTRLTKEVRRWLSRRWFLMTTVPPLISLYVLCVWCSLGAPVSPDVSPPIGQAELDLPLNASLPGEETPAHLQNGEGTSTLLCVVLLPSLLHRTIAMFDSKI